MTKSYLTRFDEAFHAIGTPGTDTGQPRYNDIATKAAAEFAVASRLRTLANARYESAKSALELQFLPTLDGISVGKGKQSVFNNPYCTLSAQRTRGQTRIDATMLTNKLVVDHKMKLPVVINLLADCSKEDKPALRIEAVLHDKA